MWMKWLVLMFLVNSAFAHTYWGKKVYLGNGYARSFVEKDHKGRVKELGVAMSHDSLSGLGHEMKEYVLHLPKNIRVKPYKFITLDWNPHGHEPEDIYGLPHFDFHFYLITRAQQLAIDCGEQDSVCMNEVPGKYVASHYVPTPAGVPRMGWHWVDSLSPELNGKKFTRTYIYGYNDGKMIFVEPMITLEYLLSKVTNSKTVRLPDHVYHDGYYPKSYEVSYDKHHKLHKITLKNFRYLD